MTFKLTATLTHKSYPKPLIKELLFNGTSLDDVLEKMEAPREHIHNLKHHRRTAFRDAFGVKHQWVLTEAA